MRSPYEDRAAIAADNNNDLAYKYQYNNSNNNNNNNVSLNNNNNSYYKNYKNGNGNSNGNGAIPYHARENSLPFSYGQIGKTSTPLRKTPTPTKADSFLDFDFADSAVGVTATAGAGGAAHNLHGRDNVDDAGNLIKTQPRLVSPLLVRKTLGSRSPTRSTTIANTYHYNSGSSGSGSGSGRQLPTPPRDDFEQLLRERREKVFNEYRVPPTPPQRQHYLTSNSSTTNGSHYAAHHSYNGGRSQAQDRPKYNYDFEFNLNLNADELDNAMGVRPRPAATTTYAHTLERSSMPQPYNTRNIDVDVIDGAMRGNSKTMSTFVERNYHTINSGGGGGGGGVSGGGLQFDERPPLEVTYKRQQQQQQQQATPTQLHNAYGNGANIYGQNNIHIESQQTLTRSRRDLSPIYATTTKQQQQQQQMLRSSNPNTNGNNYNNNTYTGDRSSTATQLSPATPGVGRPETPAFPVTPRTPYGTQLSLSSQQESIYQTAARSRLNSTLSNAQEPQEVAAHLVKFARNSAKFWYKAMLSREDAIALLLNAPPGTFVVRDSTTYKNAYGLVLRVAQPPPGSSGEQPQDLVRHFLIEPTQRGVRLKGCANEPVFTSLSALVYEHSINQLALPCLLRIPDADVVPTGLAQTPAQQHLLMHGAATNVLWLFSCDTESLTGNEAIRKAIRQLYAQQPLPTPTEVHFKVSQQGITLTDNTRKKFFRKHYTAEIISHCAIDPDNRLWSDDKRTIFAFVARRSHSSQDNQCHVFCDMSSKQPASAIVSFANRTLPTEKQRNYVL